MTNRAVELHDSQLLGTSWEGPDLVFRMSVYLHVTDGRPGRDLGSPVFVEDVPAHDER